MSRTKHILDDIVDNFYDDMSLEFKPTNEKEFTETFFNVIPEVVEDIKELNQLKDISEIKTNHLNNGDAFDILWEHLNNTLNK